MQMQILRGYDTRIYRIHGNHSFSGLLGPHYKNNIYRYEL